MRIDGKYNTPFRKALFLSMILLLIGTNAKLTSLGSGSFDDQIDQRQINTRTDFYRDIEYEFQEISQSFRPTLDTLTRVEIFCHRNSEQPRGDFTISIRSSVDGQDLALTTKSYEDIPLKEGDWIEFDFDDIHVNPGETYYIACREGIDTHMGGYEWCGTSYDSYNRGKAWGNISPDFQWQEITGDLCFKTYGYNTNYNEPPIIQLIYPDGGETLSGTVTVRWYAIDGEYNNVEDLPIYLFYRLANGNTWNRIDDVLPNTGEYEWSTNSLSDDQYILLIEAVDSNNNIAHEKSDPFIIDNNNAGITVSEVCIIDTTIDSQNWVKDGDTVKIFAEITGGTNLDCEDITADLSGFGKGAAVYPISYDGFTATWATLSDAQCIPSNGLITVSITAYGIDSNTATIKADNTNPELTIDKPVNGLYFFNTRLLPLSRTIIIGAITIELDTDDNNGIDRAEFYIDGDLKETDTSGSFEWYMNQKLRGQYNLEIMIYDHAGNKAIESRMITVHRFFGN